MTELELAERYVSTTGVSVFVTGKAGTGKTTFLRHIVSSVGKRCVVLAPTGVAAVNAGGVTIHSFFQLPLCPYLPDVKELVTEYQMPDKYKSLRKEKIKIIRTLDLMIIDEISMVRADLMDAVDMTLRRYRRSSKPFGGVQLLMIGDVQQLPPVVRDDEKRYIEQVYSSPFFFNSKALKQLHYVTIELTRVFRQQDNTFVDLLNNIRENRFDATTLEALNARYVRNFNPPDNEGYIRLTTHNYQANEVNRRKLMSLEGKPIELEATLEGNFPEMSFPTDEHLVLKKGAQVMFVKNDSSGGSYYNGKIATVEGYDAEEGVAVVDSDGNHIVVGRERWENIKYEIDPADNQIKQKVDGSFVQYPLRLAWAVTIHKSQGLTFDKVIVDAASAFTYGQVYVALSRCRTLEGLVLASPISASCAFDNEDVLRFNSSFPSAVQVEQELGDQQAAYFYDVLFELFDVSVLYRAADRLNAFYQSHLRRVYPEKVEGLHRLVDMQLVPLMQVSERFHHQLSKIRMQSGGDITDATLKERVGKGVEYFKEQYERFAAELKMILDVEVKSKTVAPEFNDLTSNLRDVVGLQRYCLARVGENGFSPEVYNRAKADYLLGKESEKKGKRKTKSPRQPIGFKTRQKPAEAALEAVEKIDEAVEMGASRSKQPAEQKPKKAPVWIETARMHSEGMSIAEIAQVRGLAQSTVCDHLIKSLSAGIITIDTILTSEQFDDIVDYILENENPTLTEMYNHFEGRYEYYQLRAALMESKDLRESL